MSELMPDLAVASNHERNANFTLDFGLEKRCPKAVGPTAVTAAWRCVAAAFVDLSVSTEPESAYVTASNDL